MRLLFLSPYPPYPPRGGGALRMYNILIGLAAAHDVWLLTFAPDATAVAALQSLHTQHGITVVTVPTPPARSLVQRGITTLTTPLPDMALRSVSAPFATKLRTILLHRPFDVVQVESIEMAGYGVALRQQRLPIPHALPLLLLDQFNAEYVLQRRAAATDWQQWRNKMRTRHIVAGDVKYIPAALYSLVQWQKLVRYERQLLHIFDHVIVVSEQDKHALAHLTHDAALTVVPNGVDTSYFDSIQQHIAPPDRHSTNNPAQITSSPLLVFTGTLDFRPNVDAIQWFVQHILPLVQVYAPHCRFVIVGRKPAPSIQALHNGTSVVVTGEVLDVRPFIAAADCYVVPMRIGGGVRLKVLEAMSMCTPIVATTVGAEGIEHVVHGHHMLIADTPTTFAAAIHMVLSQHTLRRAISQHAHTLVQTHYDWHVIVPRLARLYEQL